MNRMMKTALVALVSAFATTSAFATGSVYAYGDPSVRTDSEAHLGAAYAPDYLKEHGKLDLGKWYTDWATCKKYAEDNGIPVVFIWSNHGCIHCWYSDLAFLESSFKEWAATHDEGKVIYCFMSNKEKDANGKLLPDQENSAAYNWMYSGGGSRIDAYPFTSLYWVVDGKVKANVRQKGDKLGGTGSLTAASIPIRAANTAAAMEKAFAGWKPPAENTYEGGYFAATNAPYSSPQADSATKYVDVEVFRISQVATNQQMKIFAPGKTAETVDIDWAEGQTTQIVTIDGFKTKWFAEGKDVTLQLIGTDKDGQDAVMSETTVKCLTAAEAKPSAGAPKWIDESFDFGEWTMNLDKAKEMVGKKSGDAYTLVLMAGSLWCPDCCKTDAHFLNLTDESGNNRFEAWAKKNNVALVQIDLPRLTGGTDMTPTLLSRTPGLGGFTADDKSAKTETSGTGYLTRKMVLSDKKKEVADILARNVEFAQKNTYEGGFHRPEDTNPYRTGVPIFVLLRKDGSVAARLTQWASVSPTASDEKYFDDYLKRFDEMLVIARENETEIENNGATASNRLSLMANGGSEDDTLSHVDQIDVFRLDGVNGNALQNVMVTGDAPAQVTVSLVTTNAAGKTETLASADGKLSDSISLTHLFDKSGSYFVAVKANAADNAFKIDSSVVSNFTAYTVSGSAVYVPQEDKAKAKPPAGSDTVKVQLKMTDESGNKVVYRMAGLDVTACAGVLEPVDGAPAGFFTAKQEGIADITLLKADGELEYQIWNSGAVGFSPTARAVEESVCDLEGQPLSIRLQRTDGKSGAIAVTVTVDKVSSTFDRTRFWFGEEADKDAGIEFVELKWDDGDRTDKYVKLYIDDDIFHDGNATVVLNAATDGGEAGDVEIAEGKGVFTLTVIEDDKQEPGKAFFCGADPDFARKGIVYARETEGATIFATRIESYDGLIAGVLSSTVKGTQFSSENPRDVDDIEGIGLDPELIPAKYKGSKVLYWSSREGGEKGVKVTGIPAGKTARITFTPINMKTISASNAVTVVSVADDAPGFERSAYDYALTRYIDWSDQLAVTKLSLDVEAKNVSFSKISGTLPAGLTVGYNATAKAMTISGTPTAKAGVYESVYQVSERRGGKVVKGLVATVRFTVADVTAKGAHGEPPLNPACATSRTLKDIPLVDAVTKRLQGVLQLTIPASGKLSAKMSGFGGTKTFAASGWTEKGLGNDLYVSSLPAQNDKDYMLTVDAFTDGTVGVRVDGPQGIQFNGLVDGSVWKKDDVQTAADESARPWKGYYTAVLEHKSVMETEKGIAPRGNGFLLLKMDTTSAVNSGVFSVAGMLPNGTKFSGSTTLQTILGEGYLSVFKSSTKDLFSVCVRLEKNAFGDEDKRQCVSQAKFGSDVFPSLESPITLVGSWQHKEPAKVKGDYNVDFTLFGSYYDPNDALCKCFSGTDEEDLDFYVGGDSFAKVKVTAHDIKSLDTGKLRLSYTRSTGVVSGAFLDADSRKAISYSGVVVNGFICPECGGVGEKPLMGGSCYWNAGSPRRTLGDSVSINVPQD